MAAGPLVAALIVIGRGRRPPRPPRARQPDDPVAGRRAVVRRGDPHPARRRTRNRRAQRRLRCVGLGVRASSSCPRSCSCSRCDLVVPVFAPIGEEPGWRGFALPRLQAEHSPLVSTLILGIVVAVWHVPLIFLTEEHFSPIFLVATVAVTFFYTWIFNHTRGSVFMTIVAHAAEGVIAGSVHRERRLPRRRRDAVRAAVQRGMVRGRARPRRVRPQDVAHTSARLSRRARHTRRFPGPSRSDAVQGRAREAVVRTVMVTTTRHDKGASP